MKRIAAFFLSLAACISVLDIQAQITPCFTVDAVKGCIPFTIHITDCSGSTSATPFYNYDYINRTEGSTTTSKIHTYNTPGTYRIHQFITNDIPANSYDIDIVVVASPAPVFTLKSCAGNTVDVTITGTDYDQYQVDFNDGSPKKIALPGSTTSYAYSTEGMKSVTVTGSFNPNISTCGSQTSSVYALTAVVKPDIIDLTVLKQHTTAGSAKVNFNGITGQTYRIDRSTNGGTFVPLSTIAGSAGVQSYTDNNLNTQTDKFEYRVVAFNTCGLEIPSEVIYSISINPTASSNQINNIDWNTSPAVASFELKRDGSALPLATPTSVSYSDNTVECEKSYCYQTTATLTTNTLSGAPHKSYSIDTCITAKFVSVLPKVNEVNSGIDGNNASISWTNVTGISNYSIYVSKNSGAYSLLGTAASSPYTYSLTGTTDNYCYQVTYRDKCGNTSSISSSTCPVILTAVQTGSSIILSWNAYAGYNNTGVLSYTIQKLDEAGNVLSEIPAGTGTTYTESVTLTEPYLNYRIKVTPVNATFAPLFSNNSLFKFEAQVFVPDVFTPNGDGVNDHFYVKSKYVNTYSIIIYTRWGEVVYTSSAITEGWNGMNNTEYAQEGAYTYKITGTDINNKEFIQTGTITLAR